MAKLQITNLTQYKLAVPVANITLGSHISATVTLVDIDEFYNDPNVQKLMAQTPKISVVLLEDSTPGAEGDAVLPILGPGEVPPAAANPGMMYYSLAERMIFFSNGTDWMSVASVITCRNSNQPDPTALPNGYLVYNTETRTLMTVWAGQYLLTTAAGVQHRPSHLFPSPGTVPIGSLMLDTDVGALRLNNGTEWIFASVLSVEDWVSMPNPADYGNGYGILIREFDGLAYKIGATWKFITPVLQTYKATDRPKCTDVPVGMTLINGDSQKINYNDGANWRDALGVIDP